MDDEEVLRKAAKFGSEVREAEETGEGNRAEKRAEWAEFRNTLSDEQRREAVKNYNDGYFDYGPDE